MSATWFQDGLQKILATVVNAGSFPNDYNVRLYTNDRVPQCADGWGDYVELSCPGYIPPLSRLRFQTGWVLDTDRGACEGEAKKPSAFAWTVGPQLGTIVYGYIIARALDDTLLAGERFGSPVALGGSVTIELEPVARDRKYQIFP